MTTGDPNALVSLPALSDLEVINVATAGNREMWRSVIAELRARGVTVDAQ